MADHAAAAVLLEQWDKLVLAQSRHHTVDVQIEKDHCAHDIYELRQLLLWGCDEAITRHCEMLAPKLDALSKKIVLSVLSYNVN